MPFSESIHKDKVSLLDAKAGHLDGHKYWVMKMQEKHEKLISVVLLSHLFIELLKHVIVVAQ